MAPPLLAGWDTSTRRAAAALYTVIGSNAFGFAKARVQIEVKPAVLPPESLRYREKSTVYAVSVSIVPNESIAQAARSRPFP